MAQTETPFYRLGVRFLTFTALIALSLLIPSGARAELGALDSIRESIRSGDQGRAIGALLALEPTTEDATERTEARFLLGKLLTEQGSTVGLGYLQSLPTPMPAVEDRRIVWLARAQAVAGPSEDAVKALRAALKHASGADEAAQLRLALASVEDALGRWPESAEILRSIAAGKGARHLRATALHRLATREDEPLAERKRRAHRLLLYFPDTPQAMGTDLPVTVEDLSDRERLRRAERLMKRFDYDTARPELHRLAEHAKHGRDARWNLANIGLTKLRDDPEGARALFKREIALDGRRKEEALFSLIRTHVKADQYTQALRLSDRYDREYPRGKYAERVAYYRGWLPYDERKCTRALPELRKYVKRFGKRRSYVR
ncbi:MAG: tetratricopeptide repeat protein, partial [Myxococcota bacterium]|nr:tetratricopeptide repeat protein [Myxococcota bacterium]